VDAETLIQELELRAAKVAAHPASRLFALIRVSSAFIRV
jgi:hypothetical protein